MKSYTKEQTEAKELFLALISGLHFKNCSKTPGAVINRLSQENRDKLKHLTSEMIQDWIYDEYG